MALLHGIEAHVASKRRIRDDGAPSVSMALLDLDGRLTSHVITDGSETRSTVYQACSISNAITALAVARLVDSGKLTYQDRVVDLVPQELLEQLGKTEAHMQRVTVGSLLSHTSGLSHHEFPGYPSDSPPPLVEHIFHGHAPANTPRITFSSPPLAQLSYSGGGYLLLQTVLEHVLGQSFRDLMQRLVLGPLGMNRSTFGDLNTKERDYAQAFATAEVPGTTAPRGFHIFPEHAAAGLWTTPTDLLKAVQAVQSSLENDGGFLSTKTARAMLTKVTPNHDALSMAMGWGSDELFFGHRGDNRPGYNAYVFGSHGGQVNNEALGSRPGARRHGAFAIMTNSELGFGVIQKLVAAVFFVSDWPPVQSLPGNFGSMLDFVPYRARGRAVGKEGSWRAWVGDWGDGWSVASDEADMPRLIFNGMEEGMVLHPAAEVVHNADGSRAMSFVTEGCNVSIRLLQDQKRKLEVVQSRSRQVLSLTG